MYAVGATADLRVKGAAVRKKQGAARGMYAVGATADLRVKSPSEPIRERALKKAI